MRQVEYVITQGNATTFVADVLALKYARAFHGADKAVSQKLESVGISVSRMQPEEGSSALVRGNDAVGAAHVLFIGVSALGTFRYEQIRAFARDALTITMREVPGAREIAMTPHGTGYGLDEVESCLSQFEGCLDALLDGRVGPQLSGIRRITLVALNSERVTRLRDALGKRVKKSDARVGARQQTNGVFVLDIPEISNATSRQASATAKRGHAFVAMPFSDRMKDVFYYGIQGPIRDAGLICERMDYESFTGDIVQRLRERIASASVIVADLTGANPSVYLEVGYAWGKDRPVLLVADISEGEVAFDVRGHKRIMYSGIRDLEEKLGAELTALRSAGRI
ncbi:MAG TPA: hypothetical protein VFQ25_15485 [Ktedonobacterales bacterium]|nr:hypothetical protein [Ktedonobacterales bacterium]